VADPELTAVVPVYNSAGTLPALASRLAVVLERLDPHYEIVFIDDGSADDSWAVLRDVQAASPGHIHAVQLMRNYGQHNALMCGFRHARGRYLVTLDDDLQNPPEEIPKLVHAVRASGLDLVYGVPDSRNHAAFRNLGSALVNAFFRRVFRSAGRVTPFRVVRRELVESVLPYRLNFTFVDGLFAWNTQRVGHVRVEHHPRADGRSGYSAGKLAVLAVNLFTNFSLLPLQLVSACGFLAATAGLLLALACVALYFTVNVVVPGWASIMVTVLVLGGIQLLSLGIMGEYLGRLHMNVNRKPQYVERNRIGQALTADQGVRSDSQAVVAG
jgi:polyisoprenyl-phosphate glycosyltransferase